MSPTGRRSRRRAAETREHVLDVAYELFYWQGIHVTGVDRVAQAAGIAPTTLYRLFRSKDDLVNAYVERCGAGYVRLLGEATDPSAGSARERILAMFDAIEQQVRPENCRGCPFLMALAEYPEAQAAIHASAVRPKAWVWDRLRALAAELDPDAPHDHAGLADQLALLVEGIYGSVQALGADGPAAQARRAAEALIDAATRPGHEARP